MIKNPSANAADTTDGGFIPGSGRFSRVGNGNPLQDSWMEIPCQRSLAGYSLWGHEDLDVTEYTWAQHTIFDLEKSG